MTGEYTPRGPFAGLPYVADETIDRIIADHELCAAMEEMTLSRLDGSTASVEIAKRVARAVRNLIDFWQGVGDSRGEGASLCLTEDEAARREALRVQVAVAYHDGGLPQ